MMDCEAKRSIREEARHRRHLGEPEAKFVKDPCHKHYPCYVFSLII